MSVVRCPFLYSLIFYAFNSNLDCDLHRLLSVLVFYCCVGITTLLAALNSYLLSPVLYVRRLVPCGGFWLKPRYRPGWALKWRFQRNISFQVHYSCCRELGLCVSKTEVLILCRVLAGGHLQPPRAPVEHEIFPGFQIFDFLFFQQLQKNFQLLRACVIRFGPSRKCPYLG